MFLSENLAIIIDSALPFWNDIYCSPVAQEIWYCYH